MVKHLKMLRTNRGISQQQLAKVLGISQQSVNKYENHKIEPDIATLSAIADYFSVSIDYLVGRAESLENTEYLLYDLSNAEREMIGEFRKLSETERRCVRIMIANLAKSDDL